jgi:ribosomal protein S18 acetylase RimI-like enzyme
MKIEASALTGNLLRELWELNNACFPEAERPDFGMFEYIATQGTVFAIYSYRSELAGLAVVTEKEGGPHLWTIAVKCHFRCDGYGGELLDEVHNAFPTITLTTRIDNVGAQVLYLKHGYRVERILKRYYPNKIDGLFMRRKYV